MAKIAKNTQADESSALEIIELAIDDIDVLTRAFNLIQDVCNEINHPHLAVPQIKESLIN